MVDRVVMVDRQNMKHNKYNAFIPGFLLRFVKEGKKFPIAGNFVTCPHAGWCGGRVGPHQGPGVEPEVSVVFDKRKMLKPLEQFLYR